MPLENDVMRLLTADGLYGRRQIFTNKPEITEDNVIEILESALAVDSCNVREIEYLWNVYRGDQDIKNKTKIVRPEVNNKVVVNLANYIVTFKDAYLLSSPVQYIAATGEDEISEAVDALNNFMYAEDKESKDKRLVNWMHICGVAPRMVLPNPDYDQDDDESSPALLYALDPREAFVIYYSGIGRRPMAGVLKQYDEDGEQIYYVYVKNGMYTIKKNKVADFAAYDYGRVPIVEYVNNAARIGAFEVVLPPMNAVNTLESNRIDNVVDFVNAYDVFKNCEIDAKTYSDLTAGGQAIMIRSTMGLDASVTRITSELNQTGVQTNIDDLLAYIDVICGLPNRNGGSSTSDTGTATIYRDGWADAESRADDTEKLFVESEKEILKLMLRIFREKTDIDLSLKQVKVKFTRKNLANSQSKAQVLCELLNNPKVHPKIAYLVSGVLPDVEEAYRMGMEWYEAQEAKTAAELEKEINLERSVQNNRQDNSPSEPEDSTEI